MQRPAVEIGDSGEARAYLMRLRRDLASDQHLTVILIAFQSLVTIASARAAGLDQTSGVAVQEPAARDDITPAAIRCIRGVLGVACGTGKDRENDSNSRRI